MIIEVNEHNAINPKFVARYSIYPCTAGPRAGHSEINISFVGDVPGLTVWIPAEKAIRFHNQMLNYEE